MALPMEGATQAPLNAPIAHLDRALGFEPRGREFESLWAHQKIK